MQTFQHKPTSRRTQLSPEEARAEFDELAPFLENQQPKLRFLSTGLAGLDSTLGGAGLSSSSVTHWRTPRDVAANAVLLQVCRAACARGERVCLVDAANRFDAATLRAAGLDAFAARGLFERLHLTTFAQVAQLVDAWRRGEIEGAPALLVMDSLVAAVGASLPTQQRPHKSRTSSKSSGAKTSGAPVLDPRAQKQGHMFSRLLVKLNGFARSCGAGLIVVEPPLESMKLLPRYQSKRRRNDFLEYAAQDALADVARVELTLETNAAAMAVVRVCVAPNRFARIGGTALIDVRDRIRTIS